MYFLASLKNSLVYFVPYEQQLYIKVFPFFFKFIVSNGFYPSWGRAVWFGISSSENVGTIYYAIEKWESSVGSQDCIFWTDKTFLYSGRFVSELLFSYAFINSCLKVLFCLESLTVKKSFCFEGINYINPYCDFLRSLISLIFLPNIKFYLEISFSFYWSTIKLAAH